MTDATPIAVAPEPAPAPVAAVPAENVLGEPDVSAYPGVRDIAAVVAKVAPYVSNDPKATGPGISFDVNGIPHLTLALTKATKAHIAGIATLVTGAAGYALSYEPDSVGLLKPITAGAIVLGFAVLSWLGVAQATNLPKKVK